MKKEDFDNLPNRYDDDSTFLSQYIVLEQEFHNKEEEYDEEEYDEDDDDNWDLVDYFAVSYASVGDSLLAANDNSFQWARMEGYEFERMLESMEKDTKYRICYFLGTDDGSWINVKIKPVAKLNSGTVYFEKDDSSK